MLKTELEEKINEYNGLLREKDNSIFKLQQEIENLKHNLKTNKSVDVEVKKILDNKNRFLEDKAHNLETQNKLLMQENARLQEELVWYKSKKKNSRGAGRKFKATEEQIIEIHKLKNEGLSYGKIAKEIGLSVGTVYNILNCL